ncbi:MAG: hypothetical protein EXS40_09760 [Opitutaceae bacterium]|nr:hypothetical protein [Opitutaceae bacterium]
MASLPLARAAIFSLLLLLVAATRAHAATPATVFDDIKARATPDELYRLLFALPKGGDLHHHSGGGVPMDYVVEYYTNPARNRGQKFYLRTTIADVPSAPTPAMSAVLVHVFRESTWKTYSPALRDQWKLVTDLTAEEKVAWLSGLKVDLPGEGRDAFF